MDGLKFSTLRTRAQPRGFSSAAFFPAFSPADLEAAIRTAGAEVLRWQALGDDALERKRFTRMRACVARAHRAAAEVARLVSLRTPEAAARIAEIRGYNVLEAV